jgi:membrane-associated phospholipid phosphatase
MLEELFDESRSSRVTTRPLLRQSPESPPTRPQIVWGLRPGLLVAAAVCALLVWVTQRVFVQSGRGQGWDEGWRVDVAQAAGKVWEARAHDFGVMSLRLGLLLCLVLALIALARRQMDLFVRGAVVVAGANATTQILKRVVIERPDFSVGYGPNALPSGHVTLVASVVIGALIVLPAATRPLVALVGGAWVIVVSVATVMSGWHRPSDVVAALLICAGWAALVGSVRTTTRWTSPATAR